MKSLCLETLNIHSLNKSWVTEEITMEIIKYLKLNDNRIISKSGKNSIQRVIYIFICLQENLKINEISIQIKMLEVKTKQKK